jgi:hypothetical protein
MLSKKAENIIDKYFNLPFKGIDGVRAPYFINKQTARRGQLRGLIGKGTPEEIVEEAKILSIQYKHGIFDKNGFLQNTKYTKEEARQMIRNFLIDNGIGIDCSGFVAHVLSAHYAETYNIHLPSILFFYPKNRWFRNMIAKFRPIENTSVNVLAHENNSDLICDGKETIKIGDIRPADIIVMLEIKENISRNHILVITENKNNLIEYAHARTWNCEGRYGHGVSRGEIQITNSNGNLLEQQWKELGKINNENETYLEAKNSKILEIRRIKIKDN